MAAERRIITRQVNQSVFNHILYCLTKIDAQLRLNPESDTEFEACNSIRDNDRTLIFQRIWIVGKFNAQYPVVVCTFGLLIDY